MAIRKNRRENGSRADPTGSNPHSKGDLFSRSMEVFLDNTVERNIMIPLRVKIISVADRTAKIIFPSGSRLDDWKSHILNYIKKITTPSIKGDEKENSYNINKMSISGCQFKSDVVVWGEVGDF